MTFTKEEVKKINAFYNELKKQAKEYTETNLRNCKFKVTKLVIENKYSVILDCSFKELEVKPFEVTFVFNEFKPRVSPFTDTKDLLNIGIQFNESESENMRYLRDNEPYTYFQNPIQRMCASANNIPDRHVSTWGELTCDYKTVSFKLNTIQEIVTFVMEDILYQVDMFIEYKKSCMEQDEDYLNVLN